MTQPNNPCGEFLDHVDQLHDDETGVHLTAHTSSVSADAWNAPEQSPTDPAADDTN